MPSPRRLVSWVTRCFAAYLCFLAFLGANGVTSVAMLGFRAMTLVTPTEMTQLRTNFNALSHNGTTLDKMTFTRAVLEGVPLQFVDVRPLPAGMATGGHFSLTTRPLEP